MIIWDKFKIVYKQVFKILATFYPIPIYIYIIYFMTFKNSQSFMYTLFVQSNKVKFIVILDLIIYIFIWNKIRFSYKIFTIVRYRNRILIGLETILKLTVFTFLFLDGLYILFYNLDRLIYHEINDYLHLLNYKIVLFLISGVIFETIKKTYKIFIILFLYLVLYYNIIPIIFVIELLIILIILYFNRLFDHDLDL